MSLQQIKYDSRRIYEIYDRYQKIHNDSEELKKEIQRLELKLLEFNKKTQETRKMENEFYEEISEKFNVPVKKVKNFIANLIINENANR